MKVFINQSIFIPWKGFFDNIAAADLYIVYDHVAFNQPSFRNRNKIQTAQGPSFVSIPVQKMPLGTAINKILIADDKWGTKCWNKIESNYRKAKFYKEYANEFKPIFKETTELRLSEINLIFIQRICELLNINTPIALDTDFQLAGERNQKLISLCHQCNATHYLSGPGAKEYLDIKTFKKNGIEVEFSDYDKYQPYSQMFHPFSHYVSILDMLFNLGPQTSKYMLHP